MANRTILTGSSSEIKDFWNLMGLYFSNRDVNKELGYQMYDDINTIWFLLVIDNKLIGFCSLHNNKNISFNHDYINNKFRRLGYYNELFNHRLEYTKNNFNKPILITTKNDFQITYLLKFGFKIINKIGRYYKLKYIN